jgi:hypothetical protein
MSNESLKTKIENLIENGYAETHVGYHSDYREWNGYPRRGAYAQIAKPYGGTKRIYERSYSELYISVLEYVTSLEQDRLNYAKLTD